MSSAAFAVAPLREVMRAGLADLTSMFSPTKNPCIVKVTPMKGMRRFRYDPYKASVIAPSVMSPEKTTCAASPVKFCSYAQPVPQVAAAAYYAPYPAAAYSAYYAPASYDMPAAHSYPTMCEVIPAAPSRAATVAVAPSTVIPVAVDCAEEDVAPTRSSSVQSIDAKTEETAMRYAIVKFKHDTYPYLAPFRVNVGDIVLVEGDRGENLGTVKEITTTKPARPVAYKVVRKATTRDRELLAQLRRKEQNATKFCDNAVKEHGLNMSIVDTEYQYDQQKLSVYYKSKGMVDFRRLQRVLFREFRCRVWLVNWNEVETEQA
jgi:hypothetical protein